MTRFAVIRSRLIRAAALFPADRRGATAIEYGLMVALISLAIVAALEGIGSGLKTTLYGNIATALQNMSGNR
jgi:pilus assembly protein Flp/PilA